MSFGRNVPYLRDLLEQYLKIDKLKINQNPKFDSFGNFNQLASKVATFEVLQIALTFRRHPTLWFKIQDFDPLKPKFHKSKVLSRISEKNY